MSSYSDFANAASDILLKKGQAEAGAKQASGQLWGSTIANLGQVIPQQVQQAMAQVAQKKKTAQIQSIIQQNGGDLDKALPQIMSVDATIGAKLADEHARVQESIAKVQKIQTDAQEAQRKYSEQLWGQVDDESSYAHAALVDKALGGTPLDHYDPDWVTQKKQSLLPLKDQLDANKPMVVGGNLVTPQGKVVYEGEPKAPPQPTQASIAMQAAGGDPNAALKLLKPEPTITPYQQAEIDRQNAVAAEQARHNKVMEARPVGGVSAAAAGALDPDGLELAATDYRLTHRLPARNAQQNGAIISLAAKQAKLLGESPASTIQKQAAYQGDAKALQKMQGMSAAAEAFESKANAQADIIRDLSAKVPRTSFPLINSVLQGARTSILGNEDATKLANAISTFSAEYAKIIEGATGSAAGSSESARKASDKLINAAMSKGTMAGVLDLMQQEMSLTVGGYGSVISHISERMGGAPAPAATPAAPAPASAPQGATTGRVGPYTYTVVKP